MEQTLRNLLDMVINKGVEILIALAILLIGFKLSKLLIKLIKKGRGFNKLDKNVQTFTVSFINVASKIIVLLIVAGVVGIPTASLITLIGSAGVAIGLALQGGLSNVAGSLLILINKPFEIGDYVDAGGSSGTVTNITMFYTELSTVDNKKVVIPNGQLTNGTIVNYSANGERQLDLKFGVSYESDIEKVKKAIIEALTNTELVIKEEDFLVRVLEFADSAIIFRVRAWVKTEDYWNAYYDVEENVKNSFDKHGVEIPFNQLDVHMKK